MFQRYVLEDRKYNDHRFRFLIADAVAEDWYRGEGQESPERLWCTSHIRPGMTIVDAGSHQGMWAVIFALHTGPRGRVISYDPLPFNAEITAENAELNRLSNIDARPLGLASINGDMPVHSGVGNVVSFSETQGHSNEMLKCVRLDDDLPGVQVDFLKVDVEGGELGALQGAPRILAQKPIINLELHNALFEDRRAVATEIFRLFDPARWVYHVLPEQDEPIRIFDGPLDVDWLGTWNYPHIFGIPRA
jgi:FkbM family methyltransferase